ncbi:hypothetical protein NW070_04865 [Mycoplasmopsis cynos]|nr:hypothetical protein [Mycoplasmopsis cynos]UWV77973.1 hypothetical protein NW070_04865 [Mycoplasmopsis cynos]
MQVKNMGKFGKILKMLP